MSMLVYLLVMGITTQTSLESPIYPVASIETETYYSSYDDAHSFRRNFSAPTEPVTESNLAHSKARVESTPDHLRELSKRSSQDAFENKDIEYRAIVPDSCASIEFGSATLHILQTELLPIDAEGKPEVARTELVIDVYASRKEPQPGHEKVLCTGCLTVDNSNYKRMKFLTERYHNDDRRFDYQLRGIADIDNDGQHEIVIERIGYAGRGFIIVKYYMDQLISIPLHGDSWD